MIVFFPFGGFQTNKMFVAILSQNRRAHPEHTLFWQETHLTKPAFYVPLRSGEVEPLAHSQIGGTCQCRPVGTQVELDPTTTRLTKWGFLTPTPTPENTVRVS